MPQSAIATAADYADAMMSARRALKWVFFLLLVTLLGQIALFLLVHYQVIRPDGSGLASPVPTTLPSVVETTQPVAGPNAGLRFLVGFTEFLGMIFALLLNIILLLLLLIMLVGRLIGVSRVTSAFIWCVVLALFLFPWQAFVNWQSLDAMWQFPGVLYSFAELALPRVLSAGDWRQTVLMWFRFLGYPALAVITLLTIQVKAIRGLRLALGETEIEQADEVSG